MSSLRDDNSPESEVAFRNIDRRKVGGGAVGPRARPLSSTRDMQIELNIPFLKVFFFSHHIRCYYSHHSLHTPRIRSF